MRIYNALMPPSLLIIDDDALMRRSLAFSFEKSGFSVHTADSGETGLESARMNPPDVILLDINLPGMDGLDTLRQLRGAVNSQILFVTARRREFDQVLGLELGADDYVTKPFDFDVLHARVKLALRRASASAEPSARQVIRLKSLSMDPDAHTVRWLDQPVELSPREFDLLYALALEAGRVVSAEDLLARVWGAEFTGEPQVVYVHMRWLRQKLPQQPGQAPLLETIRGLGYRLNPEA